MAHFIIGARGTHVRETGLTRIGCQHGGSNCSWRCRTFLCEAFIFFYCKTQCTRTCVSMKMYTQFVFEVGKVWQSVVWPSRRRCAPLRQFRLCVFSNIWGNDAMLQLVQHMILLRTLLCMRTIFVHGLGVVNVLIGQLLRRDPRESAAGYNDGV